MAVFDYSEGLKTASLSVLGSSFVSKRVVDTTTQVVLESFFNPGHDGKATFLEYTLQTKFQTTGAGMNARVKWKIYNNNGSSWITIESYSTFANNASNTRRSGIYNTSSKMPLRVRMTLSSSIAASSRQLWVLLSTNYLNGSAMRAVGNAT